MLLDELIEQVDDTNYFLFMPEKCDVTYYNTNRISNLINSKLKCPYGLRKMLIKK
ncbi:hypothetical protein [Sporosalibacterium faouarense]|uniref:hypothetical protein n=1 Tax=Sporosalibacterium faouarense TaxID=516123 RepID=UPI00311CC1E5